jgi:hypothetical protein
VQVRLEQRKQTLRRAGGTQPRLGRPSRRGAGHHHRDRHDGGGDRL